LFFNVTFLKDKDQAVYLIKFSVTHKRSCINMYTITWFLLYFWSEYFSILHYSSNVLQFLIDVLRTHFFPLICMHDWFESKIETFFLYHVLYIRISVIQKINSHTSYLTHVDAQYNIIYLTFIFESQTGFEKDGK